MNIFPVVKYKRAVFLFLLLLDPEVIPGYSLVEVSLCKDIKKGTVLE